MESTPVPTDYVHFTDLATQVPMRASVLYGWRDGSPKYWYVEVTVEKREDTHWIVLSQGCDHVMIAKYFPTLRNAARWHGSSLKGPLKFIEQALYWFNEVQAPGPAPLSWQRVNSEEALKTALVWGALPTDKKIPTLDPTQRQAWLVKRLKALIPVLQADLAPLTKKETP